MNFFDRCLDLFMKTSQFYDLGKDIKNYNRLMNYIQNYWRESRSDIEKFILDVRADNPVYTFIKQSARLVTSDKTKPIKTIFQANEIELYYELRGEYFNIVYKGAYDSFKLFNKLSQEAEQELIKKIVNGDDSIFADYNHV